MGSKCLQIFIFLFLGILSYHALQSIFYELIYHSDNLYLPLFAQDLKMGWGRHWYLPPSTYFFPDLVGMFVLSFFMPLSLLPVSFGIFQFFSLLFVLFYFLKNRFGKHRSLRILNLLIFIFGIGLLTYDFSQSKLNPFGFFFTSGHHTSTIIICLVLLTIYRGRNQKTIIHLGLICFIVILTYSSDQFFFLYLIPMLYLRKKRENVFTIAFFFFLILVISETIRFFLSSIYHIPENHEILLQEIRRRNPSLLIQIFLRYYYDFSKIFMSRVSMDFQILLLVVLILFFKTNFPKRYRNSLVLLGVTSFLFLGIIGRFVFPHAFPIRYLFPFLFFWILSGLILTTKKIRVHSPYHRLREQSTLLFFLAFTFTYLLLVGTFKTEKEPYRNQILSYLESKTHGNRFWTNYEAEKKIRFWSERKLNPHPCHPNGKPYFWITGAFQDPTLRQTKCPILEEVYWVPNSLTKDF